MDLPQGIFAMFRFDLFRRFSNAVLPQTIEFQRLQSIFKVFTETLTAEDGVSSFGRVGRRGDDVQLGVSKEMLSVGEADPSVRSGQFSVSQRHGERST